MPIHKGTQTSTWLTEPKTKPITIQASHCMSHCLLIHWWSVRYTMCHVNYSYSVQDLTATFSTQQKGQNHSMYIAMTVCAKSCLYLLYSYHTVPLWCVVALELVVELFQWGMRLYHLLSSWNTPHKLVVDQDTIPLEGLNTSTIYYDYLLLGC